MIVKNWEDLKNITSSLGYTLQIAAGQGAEIFDKDNNWICHLNDFAFRAPYYNEYTQLLQKYGFDVVLENSDKGKILC